MPKISDPLRRSWIYRIPFMSKISDGSPKDENGRKPTDPNRITVASWDRTANARIVIAQRYACSTSAVERPGCRRSVAKAPASPESFRLCQRLPPGKKCKILMILRIYILSNTYWKTFLHPKTYYQPFLFALRLKSLVIHRYASQINYQIKLASLFE